MISTASSTSEAASRFARSPDLGDQEIGYPHDRRVFGPHYDLDVEKEVPDR
ncbi:MAG: hypothetical protein ACRDTX_22640 [Pseudonocardiaceae bacterium]